MEKLRHEAAVERTLEAELAPAEDETSSVAGIAGSFGNALKSAGFHARKSPNVVVGPEAFGFKANSFPGIADIDRGPAELVPIGRDSRFLYTSVPARGVLNETAIQDFRQNSRTVTGSVERALDATTEKATAEVAIVAVQESLKDFAVVLKDIPNRVAESIPLLSGYLASEGSFAVYDALDAHVQAQIEAASPPFGNTGTGLIAQLRNGITSMRAEGASPSVAALNPADAATLDLTQDTTNNYVFGTRATGSASPLFGLQIAERKGTKPPYLLDPQMLGVLYIGPLKIESDPFSGFSRNVTQIRVEGKALMHIRNARGARRIAAT